VERTTLRASLMMLVAIEIAAARASRTPARRAARAASRRDRTARSAARTYSQRGPSASAWAVYWSIALVTAATTVSRPDHSSDPPLLLPPGV